MGAYIDIHSHILPQVDDGSKSMKQTSSMLKIAYQEGIRTIIVTPHYQEGRDKDFYKTMKEMLEKVKHELSFFSSKMDFYLGCEIYYSHDCIKTLEEKVIPTMADSRYVLVEFSHKAEYQYIKRGLQDFLFSGYWPILAHVERYVNIIKDINRVIELVEMGAYIQINVMSVMGKAGKTYKKTVKKLLKNRLVHFVATDCHNDLARLPKIKKCANYIEKKYGKSYMEKLLIKNPNKILANEYI